MQWIPGSAGVGPERLPIEEAALNLETSLSFPEFRDATSRSLTFSHRDQRVVGYGEETITKSISWKSRDGIPKIVPMAGLCTVGVVAP